MTPNEYIKQAAATDERSYAVIKNRMTQEFQSRMLHYVLGVGTESGELLDVVKKNVIYGKDMDVVNVHEEIGDVLWYLSRILDITGGTFEVCMDLNIKKLRARYGDKFSEFDALNRNLEKERKILENNNN